MRTLDQRLSYEKLELVQPQSGSHKSALTSLASLLRNVQDWLVRAFVVSNEPRVWTRQDAQGNLTWFVQDSYNDSVVSFSSENDVRIWLEDRYSR